MTDTHTKKRIITRPGWSIFLDQDKMVQEKAQVLTGGNSSKLMQKFIDEKFNEFVIEEIGEMQKKLKKRLPKKR